MQRNALRSTELNPNENAECGWETENIYAELATDVERENSILLISPNPN